ncbi:MAG: hypothetical protein LBG71_07625 [Clostridiales Family XIII bacterium]|jgi:hypothetical protein|nr:hypothetical protein [Clostridiales Family XIII bacterium]
MSDTIFKIFPRYYYPKYTDDQIIGAINTLKLTSSEEITFTNYKSVQFIDCGDGLAQIFCPWCGRSLDVKYWREAMDNGYDGDSFQDLGLHMPCCNSSSSLEELIYVKPCGFATFVIEVHNPTVIPRAVDLHEMGKCFGNVNFFRMISAHI